jgi:hypothetical protein
MGSQEEELYPRERRWQEAGKNYMMGSHNVYPPPNIRMTK